ncbi:hypothetical protein [Streptomyces sp. NBC_01506]|uniref:hypothetical protein n=1 Tax=Streptomyces sp. NBC_01506 TaxID=2903887 RepID=UPI00386E9CE3
MIADEIRAEIEQLNAETVAPGLAAVAIRLAEALDQIPVGDAPTAQAVVSRDLLATMGKLRALSPPDVKGDVVDELAGRKARRLRGA